MIANIHGNECAESNRSIYLSNLASNNEAQFYVRVDTPEHPDHNLFLIFHQFQSSPFFDVNDLACTTSRCNLT